MSPSPPDRDRRRGPAAPRTPERPARRGTPLFQLDATDASTSPWFDRLALTMLGVLGAVVIALIAGPHRIGDIFTETDFYGAYGQGARLIEQGHFDPSRYSVVGPVHETTLALVGVVVHDLFLAAELLSLAALLFATFAWHRVVRARMGSAAACATVLFLATNGTWLRYGYSATTDMLALALQAAFALALCTGTPTTRRIAGAGVFAALAYLTRYNGIVLWPVGVVVLLAGWTGDATLDRRRGALVFSAGFLGVLVPWLGYALTHGAHTDLQLHHNIAFEMYARPKGIVWDEYERSMQSQFPTLASVLLHDPPALVQHLFVNVFDHLRLDATLLTGWAVAITAVIGKGLAWRDGSLRRLAPVTLMGTLFFLTLVPVFHSERYSLAVLPLWASLAAVAITSPRLALSLDAGGGRRVWLKALLAVVPLAFAVKASVALQEHQLRALPREALTIAREVRPLLRPGDRVMARKSYFAWHAGLDPVAMPNAESLPELAAAAREAHVRWLYFSWPEAQLRPRFAFLLDTLAHVPGLTVRAATAHYPAVLYEIGPTFGLVPAWFANDTIRTAHLARARAMMVTNDWRSRLLAALDWQRRGRYDDAQPLLDEAEALVPDDVDVLLAQGDNLVHRGEARRAREVFLHAERVMPGNAQARIGLGWATLLDGDVAQAATLWRPVIDFVDDPATLQRMAEVYARTGDREAADAVRARQRTRGVAR